MTMTDEEICAALSNPTLIERFISERDAASADQRSHVRAKWEGVAQNMLAAYERSKEIAAAVKRGEEPPGEWIDCTDRVLAVAARIRAERKLAAEAREEAP